MKSSSLHRLLWLEAILANPTRKLAFVAVAVAITKRINNVSGFAWAKQSTMASDARVSQKTVQRSIKFFGDQGFLLVHHRKGTSNQYELAFPPSIPDNIKQQLDSLVLSQGPLRPSPQVNGVRQTERKPKEKQSGPREVSKLPVVEVARPLRILRWIWGAKSRLLTSPDRARYEPELRSRLQEHGVNHEALPDDALEHLLQRVRENALTIADLLEAKALATQLSNGGAAGPP